MVAQISEASTAKELALKDESVEADIGTDTHPAGRLVFPPIQHLLDDAQTATVAAPRPNEVPERLDQGLESELNRLLSRYVEFKDSAGYLAKASRLALAVGRLEDARRLAQQAAEITATDHTCLYRLAEVHLRSHDLDSAERILQDLADSGHLLSCLRLTELAIRRLDKLSAVRWLQRACEIDQADWRVQAVCGTVALATGAFAQAVRHFRNSLEDRPRSARLHYHVALAHVLTGHTKPATRALRRAVGLDPFDKQSLMVWADLSVYGRQSLHQVSRALSRYHELFPEDRPTTNRLAYVLREQGNPAASYQVLMQVSRRTADPELLNNLGVLAAETNKLPQAVTDLAKACALLMTPSTEEESQLRSMATTNLMSALKEARSYQNAIDVAKAYARSAGVYRLLREEPDYRIAGGLVEALTSSGKLDEAAQLAEEWLDAPEIHASLEASLSEMLTCYYSLERVDRAKALFFAQRSYEVQSAIVPKNPVRLSAAINNLAFALVELGKYGEAAEYLSRMHPLPEGQHGAFAYATRGLLAIRTGKAKKGQELYQRAIGLAPGDFKNQLRKKLHWELASYWSHYEDAKRARRHLSKTLKTRPDGVWKLQHLDVQAQGLLAPRA